CAHADAAIRARRRVEDIVTHVAEATHHRPVVERAREFFPTTFASAPAIVYAPAADEKTPVRGLRRCRLLAARNRRGRRAGAREVVAPVDLPRLAAIGGEGLVPMRALALH